MDLENRLKTVGTFVPSNKGTFTVLLVEGYEYRQRYRRANGTIVWECLHANCLKRAETLEGEITAIQNHHHNPDELAEEKRKRKQRLKEDAATSARRTTRLVTATALEVSFIKISKIIKKIVRMQAISSSLRSTPILGDVTFEKCVKRTSASQRSQLTTALICPTNIQ